ncbi:MAG: TetR/AcrR family transcriptional regulator [Sterolibacterium sp.]|nr:TetR/AcrR family transcriptional regulator [Sterolibacterium sp.]
MKRAGRPVGADVAITTRKSILDAATLCFAELGYAAASNREIAKRAGVTSGSLYHYFDSKAALYRAALQDANTRLLDAYLAVTREHAEASSLDQLCLGLEQAFAVAATRPGMMRFAAGAAMEIQRNKELDWLAREDAEAFPLFFRRLLKRARQRGELAAEVNIDATINVLLISFASLAFLQGTQFDARSFEASLQSFLQLLRGEMFIAAQPNQG